MTMEVWIDGNAYVITYPISAGEILNLVLSHHTAEKLRATQPDIPIKKFRSQYRDFDPRIVRIINMVEYVVSDPFSRVRLDKLTDILAVSLALTVTGTMRSWSSPQKDVFLMSDVAHSMVNHMAQGAAASMENGELLARCIQSMVQGKIEIAEAVHIYEAERMPKAYLKQQVSFLCNRELTTWSRATGSRSSDDGRAGWQILRPEQQSAYAGTAVDKYLHDGRESADAATGVTPALQQKYMDSFLTSNEGANQDSSLFIEKSYLNGEWVDAKSRTIFDVFNSATGKAIASGPECSPEDTERAINAAAAAISSFKLTLPRARAHMLRRWANLILEHGDDLATLVTPENDKALVDAKSEVAYSAVFPQWFGEGAVRACGDVIPASVPGNTVLTIREPIRPYSLITPWNLPAAMMTRYTPVLNAYEAKRYLALADLQSKTSEKQLPRSRLAAPSLLSRLTKLHRRQMSIVELAHWAGFSNGVINVITASANTVQVGHASTSSSSIKKIWFTGSTPVGKLLIRQCTDTTLKKTSMELGGNAPFIVFDDNDIDLAVADLCVYLLYDAFTEKITSKVNEFKVGDNLGTPGITHGPLINRKAVDNTDSHVRDAAAKGAKVLVGGRVMPELGPNYYAPTVLGNITADIASEEAFGPANDTDFGPVSYFLSKDVHRIWRVTRALEVGIAGVNAGIMSDAASHFGGIKSSGFSKGGQQVWDRRVLEMVTLATLIREFQSRL
ncbi:uncharacterized protein PV07_12517 [Cladophialophora immunda]|uniref:Aldehyde dehydrogenase domain-containing protein n=1 Tax=Cladophialophora immunda TaxID=569365 RepID=A0A0D1Z388_9EURO|nr:uncharacterized protein PV07_12517 [Cladophialophora immunda]KIW22101.1 hypothetical protein PV07_12517 [Cladophialophora immunda]